MILSLLKKINKKANKEPLSVKITDVNYACKKFGECSGIEV